MDKHNIGAPVFPSALLVPFFSFPLSVSFWLAFIHTALLVGFRHIAQGSVFVLFAHSTWTFFFVRLKSYSSIPSISLSVSIWIDSFLFRLFVCLLLVGLSVFVSIFIYFSSFCFCESILVLLKVSLVSAVPVPGFSSEICLLSSLKCTQHSAKKRKLLHITIGGCSKPGQKIVSIENLCTA